MENNCMIRSSKWRSSLPLSKNVYLRPSLPTMVSFLGLVLVRNISTVGPNLSMVTA